LSDQLSSDQRSPCKLQPEPEAFSDFGENPVADAGVCFSHVPSEIPKERSGKSRIRYCQ
jgi:hypothetical protein